MTIRRVCRTVSAAIAMGALGGCGMLNDPQSSVDTLMNAPVFSGASAERAMTALTKGDYSRAESQAIATLRANPKDPYALYVAGMVYQATGRYDLARQYYEVILANRPQITITTLADGMPQVRTLVDVAQANLIMIDKLTGRYSPRTTAQSGRVPDATPQGFEPMAPQTAARGVVAARPLDDPTASSAPAAAGRSPGAQAEANVSGRFRILKRLLDEGLITPDEYTRRRATNMGALTPYSSPLPPAQGLERPVPGDEQVVERLKALGRALETRAISPAEHAGERAAILDALLPAEPRKVDLPVLPPRDVMEAASAVGRVERMRAAGLVSADESRRERDAVERVLDTQLARTPVGGTATGMRQGAQPANGNGKGNGKVNGNGKASGSGVALGTAKSEDGARQTWDKIKGRFPEELGAMDAVFRKEDLGEKGVRWRIVAGPLKSQDEARKLCKVLKLHRQSCDPAGF